MPRNSKYDWESEEEFQERMARQNSVSDQERALNSEQEEFNSTQPTATEAYGFTRMGSDIGENVSQENPESRPLESFSGEDTEDQPLINDLAEDPAAIPARPKNQFLADVLSRTAPVTRTTPEEERYMSARDIRLRNKEAERTEQGGYISQVTGKLSDPYGRYAKRAEYHSHQEKMAKYFREEILDADGKIDDSKLAGAPYPVRAWFETQMVLMGKGKERKGGTKHSGWDETLELTGAAKNRYDRLVKIAHFGGKGNIFVVPDPVKEGNFIMVGKNGQRLDAYEADRWGRTGVSDRMEQNQARMDANPIKHALARETAATRRRMADSAKEFRRGNVNIAEAKRQNLPPDHPDVVDAVQRRIGNRGWFSSGRGPSDSAAYRVSYFGESEADLKIREEQYKRAGFTGKPRDKMEAVLGNRLDVAITNLQNLEKSQAQGMPIDPTKIEQARVRVEQAEQNYLRYAPDTSADEVPTRRDLRGTMPGHWDPLYHRDTGHGFSPDAWRLSGRAGSKSHKRQMEWDSWEAPPTEEEVEASEIEEPSTVPMEDVADEIAPEPTGPGIAPDPVPAEDEELPSDWSRGTPLDDKEGPFPRETTGPLAGTSLYADMTPSTEDEAVSSYIAGETGPDDGTVSVDGLGEESADGYAPVGGGGEIDTEEQLDIAFSKAEPYQPIVNNKGERTLEKLDKSKFYEDHIFDLKHGKELWNLRNRMDSLGFTPEDFSITVKEGSVTAGSSTVSKKWFDTFLEQARKIVSPRGALGKKLSPQERKKIDKQIMRWGDRHLSGYSKEGRTEGGRPSALWTAESPTLKRKRKPAMDLEGSNPWWSSPFGYWWDTNKAAVEGISKDIGSFFEGL